MDKYYSRKSFQRRSISDIIIAIVFISICVFVGLKINTIENNLPISCYDAFQNETLLSMQNFSINPDVGFPNQCMNYWSCKAGYCSADKEYLSCYENNVSEQQKNFMGYCDDFGVVYLLLLGKVFFFFAMPFLIIVILLQPLILIIEKKFKITFKGSIHWLNKTKTKRLKIGLWFTVIFLFGMVIMFLTFIVILLYGAIMNLNEIISNWIAVVDVIGMLGLCLTFLVLCCWMLKDYHKSLCEVM